MATNRATFPRWEGLSMCGSRCTFLTASAGLLVLASNAFAADGGRLDLLAAEAVDVVGHSATTASRTGLLVLIGIPLTTMLAAFLGTWFGIRGLSFGSLRHKDGWREVAYRFRSEEPLTVGKHVIRRMSGVLDDIEDLGKRLRTRPAPSVPEAAAAPRPEPIAAPAPPPGVRTIPSPPRREVTFARREESAPVPERLRVRAPAPRPLAKATPSEPDRGTRYRRARALLREGHDRDAVRSMTGLKLAELDLLRCAGDRIGDPL